MITLIVPEVPMYMPLVAPSTRSLSSDDEIGIISIELEFIIFTFGMLF